MKEKRKLKSKRELEISQRHIPSIRNKSSIAGITLIALVLTIIVLLILAGVSIAMLTGNNGILTQAQKAKTETENAANNEATILDEYNKYLNNAVGGGTTGGGSTGAIDGSWSYEKGVNTPVIKENMELVKWDSTQNKFIPDETNSSYDYNNQEWANAVVTIDGVESYFVWIPRYAYKITYNNKEDISQGGIIDVKFLKGTSNIASDGTVCKYADDESLNKETDYIIHPAFTSNVDLGGWDKELTGIWVGKYESARLDATSENEGEDTKIKVQAGVISFRNTTIGNMYTYAKEYSTNLNSHMLKNSEWGAVAYLTESKYGRNGTEVDMNDQNYITAMGDIVKNKPQSSTGNETGIYDLRGGTSEKVAAYYTGGSQSYLNTGISLVNDYANENTKKYVTAYTGTDVSTNYKLGDATYETSGWHSDLAYFVDSDRPFFFRGGSCKHNTSPAGVFYVSSADGAADIVSFRMCLAVK